VTPILGKAQDTDIWKEIASSCDVIIEALADYQDHSTASIIQKGIETILKRDREKLVIYTSGVWVYGSSDKIADESTSITNAPSMVKARTLTENAYLDLGAVVVRPGCVYGKEGSLTGSWFKGVRDHKAEFPGTGDHSWATVHIDDLADAYAKIIQHKPSKQIFNLVAHTERVRDCVAAVARAIGSKNEVKFFTPTDPFNECLALNQHISSKKAFIQLGWAPKHLSFANGAEQYYNSWNAFQIN